MTFIPRYLLKSACLKLVVDSLTEFGDTNCKCKAVFSYFYVKFSADLLGGKHMRLFYALAKTLTYLTSVYLHGSV